MGLNSIIYGPVPSWRLGRSLGIDLLSTEGKTCSFDCVYCQLGRTVHPLGERREFVNMERIARELEQVKGVAADYITFSGVGEPTLASNLGMAIELARDMLKLPVAVLTNSSLIMREDTRHDLALADVVVAKVDAPDDMIFHRVNRPVGRCSFEDVLSGLRLLRQNYRGKLALQMMFIAANQSRAQDMARVAETLMPDEVQINTPLRPCPVAPLSRTALRGIERAFSGFTDVLSVYRTQRPSVVPINHEQTRRRRPCASED